MRAPANHTPAPGATLAGSILLAMLLVIGSYLLTLLLAVLCVYLPALLVASYLNIYTIMAFVTGSVLSLIMVASLIPRRDRFPAPGPRIEPHQHPRLFAEIAAIAKFLGEEPPAEVYLVPEVNAWVAERGGWMGIGDRRVMGLGLPLLRILTLSQFRAILAHEFAHYYTGDTRLGPWVYRARESMALTLHRLDTSYESLRPLIRNPAAAAVYLVVNGVLTGYWKILFQTTQLVSRKQEFRADQLASWVTGSAALAAGLRAIHGTSPVFPAYWHNEVGRLLDAGFHPPILDGFAEFIASPQISAAVSEIIATELREGRTDPADTHPPLRDRIAALGPEVAPQPVDEPSAIELIENVPALELQILELVNPNCNMASLKPIKWEDAGRFVYIPQWRETVLAFAALLAGITPATLPEALGNIRKLAAQVPNPKGILLDNSQRTEQALITLARAFALALNNSGWELHARPGQNFLERDGRRISPIQVIYDLKDGQLSPAAWLEQCQAAKIEALDFGAFSGSAAAV